MGTEIPLVTYTPEMEAPTYSFSTTKESIDVAREAFKQVKDLTIKLSMVENAAYRLAGNIKKTQKRANALKNITIPTYTCLLYTSSNASTLFDYDLALDLYYYTTLWKEKKKVLKKRELEIFTRDIGSKIDLLNLQWIYRAKKYFKMQPADIYSMIIPIHFKIHRDTVKELVETASVEEFIAHVASTYYVKRYDFDDHHTIERVYFECIQRLYTVDERDVYKRQL